MSQTLIRRTEAEDILSRRGWLSMQPAEFRKDVLRRSILLHFPAGDVVYRFGDDPGGIFGLVEGTLTINTALPEHTPQLIHIGQPGAWTGEGCFVTRGPRMIELRTLSDTWMMHLGLDQMDRIAAGNPAAVRAFSQILIASVQVLLHVIHDLQKPEPARRIASVICRAGAEGKTLPLSQTEIGQMSNTSRKQVNAALARFVANGWIKTDYRAVTMIDTAAIKDYSEGAF